MTVSDRGHGFRDAAVPEQPGFGLSLVAQLSDRYQIEPMLDGGGAAVSFARSFSH